MSNSVAAVAEREPIVYVPRTPTAPGRDESGAEIQATRDGQYPWGNFHLATIMFLRALQLKGGARPRVETHGHKLVHIAFLEVTAGTVAWEAPAALPVDVR